MQAGFGIWNTDCSACHQRNENIAQTHIKCRRRQKTDSQILIQSKFLDFPMHKVAQPLMASENGFGNAGGSGSVHYVQTVLRSGRAIL